MRRALIALLVVVSTLILAHEGRADDLLERCLDVSGTAGERCLARLSRALERSSGDVDAILAKAEPQIVASCTPEAAETLGYQSVADVVLRVRVACDVFASDLLDVTTADDPSSLSASERTCQVLVSRQTAKLRKKTVRFFGRRCIARRYAGKTCDRERRDLVIGRLRARAATRLLAHCGDDFLALGIGAGVVAFDRITDVLDTVVTRARHFAQQVFPPNDLGPTADFGPYPVGVTTLHLFDTSRMNVQGTGPRPVTLEVYYPSTDAAVEGVPRDALSIGAITLATTPAYRDVAIAPGNYPLVVFSHGNLGIRFQSFFFFSHLASHGYVVASPDHHGNTFVDQLAGIVDPLGSVIVNRPLDMSFVMDQMLDFDTTPGNFFEGTIDPTEIGMSGHSFGGLTTFELVGGTSAVGTFTDPRVKAALPQAPAAVAFTDAYFQTISVPMLILGGSIDATTPFASEQQRPYDNLPSGTSVVALGELRDAGHFTFSDFCEVPGDVLAFLGGAEEACEPRHLPWRHGQDIVRYLSLNFFDATLKGDAAALARLDPTVVASIEDLRFESK